MISIIDLILIIFLFGFIFYGFFFGFVRTIGSLAGIAIGFWAASHFYLKVFLWVKELFFGYDSTGKVIIFLLLFTIVNRLIVLLFSLLNRAFNLISIIPFLKSINRLLGAALGLIVGAAILGIIISFAVGLPFLGGWLAKLLAGSKLLPLILKFIGAFSSLMPSVLNKAKEIPPVSGTSVR